MKDLFKKSKFLKFFEGRFDIVCVELNRIGVIQRTKDYSESYDEYLEFIYHISEESPEGWVKNKDIAQSLNIKPSSVSKMLEKLSEHGYIEWKPRQGIKLTEEGRKRARRIILNHRLISLFLESIMNITDPEDVDKIACNLEHYFSETMSRKLMDIMDIKTENPFDLLQNPDFDASSIPPIYKHSEILHLLDILIEEIKKSPPNELVKKLVKLKEDAKKDPKLLKNFISSHKEGV